MSFSRRPARAPIIWIYAVSVIANYVAQVPYTIHLYGTAFSRSGALLLGATLLWFIVALRLFLNRRRLGYWLLLAYAITQALFYVNGELVLAFAGYGLPYHLSHTADLIVWLAFVVGDLNFIAAIAVVVYLLRRRGALLRPETDAAPD
ncbi:MAG: hypothetical protein M3P18_06830 [Actinomycetota bacterium]|nr:hypothetical protein [Actinomycetota bacterium]